MQSSLSTPAHPELHITEQDHRRLRAVVERFIDGRHAAAAEALETELDRARVVPQDEIDPDVLTMRSRALCVDRETGTQRELVLVYPDEADVSSGKISVLAPVGLALLGLRVGDTIRWPTPRGRDAVLELLELRYQPEADGAYEL